MNADILHKDWGIFKKVLETSIADENIDESYRLLEQICQFGYTYNFLNNFKDDELEVCLCKLCAQISKNFTFQLKEKEVSDKIIFYDFFTLDYRGFTQQYIDYFIKNEIEFLYVMYDHNYSEKKQIIKSIDNYPKGNVFIIKTKDTTKASRLRSVYDKVDTFNAGKIFIHNAPWDIFSYCLVSLLKNFKIKSYLINITDHAFWLGTVIFDYIIDFRSYGAQLNYYYRKIPLNKILIVNTSAYIDNSILFQGFPVSVAGKVVGFGGGNVYKIKDEANTFLNLIKSLLLQNDNFIFFFANVGDKDYVPAFISENKLEGKLIPIGNRDDICAIFENIDIFFNTYPYGGGNMVSYGFQNKVPVVAMYNKNYPYSRLDIVFDIEVASRYILEQEIEFFNYANNLIRSAEYRKEIAELFYNKINGKKSFEFGLDAILNNNLSDISIYALEEIKIDTGAIVAFHLQENQFQPRAYFNFKSSILINHFYLGLKTGWDKNAYWKYSFLLTVKNIIKKRLPFLIKLKKIANG